MEWLKELLKKLNLADEVVEKIVGETSSELAKYFIPKDKYNELSEAKKNLESLVAERDKQFEEFKKSVGDNEALKSEIERLQAENKSAKEGYETEIFKTRFNSALDRELMKLGAKNTRAVRGVLKINDLKFNTDSDSFENLSEMVEALKNDVGSSFLFKAQNENLTSHVLENNQGALDKGVTLSSAISDYFNNL